ncbi:uncharacterized protein LOC107016522 [Solanum pennellii]|uniref:Uncharacterized protein LOC107016522 n=1 Tax=Solanum pennellii TaxID=28526 RepID=A0ABM1GKS0_SOLPN|nr:uncharacterized protein LOC107016522 [Solanum pennellii]
MKVQIMPPRRANARNVNARNANATPPVPDKESMTNQNSGVHAPINANGRSATARVHDFVRMNPPELLGSQPNEDPRNFLHEVKKMFESQQKFSALAPWSASVPSSKNSYDQKVKAPGSKSQESVSGTKTYPTCPKCGKNHLGKCLAKKEGCFGCGKSCHRLRDCPSRQCQEGGNGRSYSTTSPAPTSRPTQQGNSSGTDPAATLCFVTPYIAVQFSGSVDTLSEPVSVSTLVGDPVIARWVY